MVANCAWAQGKASHPKTTPATATSGTKQIEKTIWKLEQQWLDALNQRDQAALDALLAPDFGAIGMEGRPRTRAQELASVLDTTRPPLTRSIGRLDMKVYDGKFVVARGLTIVNGDNIHEAHLVYTHVWVLAQGHWKCVSEQVVLENF